MTKYSTDCSNVCQKRPWKKNILIFNFRALEKLSTLHQPGLVMVRMHIYKDIHIFINLYLSQTFFWARVTIGAPVKGLKQNRWGRVSDLQSFMLSLLIDYNFFSSSIHNFFISIHTKTVIWMFTFISNHHFSYKFYIVFWIQTHYFC